MTNRIGKIYGFGLAPVDENGMEAVRPLAPGEPTPDVRFRLAELGRAWRDARFRAEQSKASPLPLPDAMRAGMARTHRAAMREIEREAERLVLTHAGVMLADEKRPPYSFEPATVAYAPGHSVRVAPGAVVEFTPSSPLFIRESLS